MPLFQNNFATNLTSGVNAGDTTSPLNSIPSVAAPFYLAFDATNLNGHYEVVFVTSKTATNVLHAALSYAHTTAEEIRLIVPAGHLNAMQGLAEGQMVNGKISPSVASNNLTVALKTNAGTDPSLTDPVYVMIGGTMRTVTSALSVTKNAGTNWCNAGGAELATKELDYFAYLGYNSTDGVVIGFSRIPFANQYSDFSVTTTNEKYCAISTITNAVATDYYNVIGRFAATLSAGAGYTWTVPTYTAINLVQKPVYETRSLTWQPTWTGFSAAPTGVGIYKIISGNIHYTLNPAAGTSNANTMTYTLPMAVSESGQMIQRHTDTATTVAAVATFAAASPIITCYKDATAVAVFATSGAKVAYGTATLKIV